MHVLFEQTVLREKYLEDRGYRVIEMWECAYKTMRKTDEDLKEFLGNYKQGLDCKTEMSVSDILSVRGRLP